MPLGGGGGLGGLGGVGGGMLPPGPGGGMHVGPGHPFFADRWDPLSLCLLGLPLGHSCITIVDMQLCKAVVCVGCQCVGHEQGH